MNSRTVILLAAGVVVLFAVVFALNYSARDATSTDRGLLLPDLKSGLNDIETVTITTADETISIRNRNGGWVVPEKSGYPANTSRLRALLLALADARKIEEKTSSPDRYQHLGVQDPAGGGGGILVSATAGDDDFAPVSVILGDSAQGEYRYARVPEEAQSWLIDRNPEVPASVAGWLSQDIVDIAPSRIRTAEIRHADGETIRLYKESPEDSNFQVEDIPDGRELSYPSAADGIAGALGSLGLEDVREAGSGDLQPSGTASFTTFDGLAVDVAMHAENDENGDDTDESDAVTWITLEASATPASGEAGTTAPGAPDDATAPAEAGAPDDDLDDEGPVPVAGTDEGTTLADDESPPDTVAAEPETTPQDEADAINERVSGWQFRIAGYKAQQLTRRWDDLLSE